MRAAARSQGRYDSVSSAPSPGDHLPREGKRSWNIHIVHGAVPEPNAALRLPTPGAEGPAAVKRQKVAINANCDVLEQMHKRGRISYPAYVAGRAYQRVLEVSRGHRSGSSDYEPKIRKDVAAALEIRLIRSLQSAAEAVALIDATRANLGEHAEMVLTLVIGKGLTLKQIAHIDGYTSNHGRTLVSATFREALEDLAAIWGKQGWPI